MDLEERKLKQNIAKRKKEVKKMIAEQEAILSSLNISAYQQHADYMRDLRSAVHKLYRLKRDLVVLESVHLAHAV